MPRPPGCHNRDTPAALARPLPVQDGWTADRQPVMRAHQPEWLPVLCGYAARATDPACAGCRWRHWDGTEPPQPKTQADIQAAYYRRWSKRHGGSYPDQETP